MPKNDIAPHKGWVKLEDLAAQWGPLSKSPNGEPFILSSRQYRNIAKEGRADIPERGYVNPLKVMSQLLAYYQGMAESKGDSTHEEEKKLKTREERLIKQMERQVMERTLIEVDKVTDDLSILFANVKTSLRAWAKRLPAILVGRTQKEISQDIIHEADMILNDLADGISVVSKKRAGKCQR